MTASKNHYKVITESAIYDPKKNELKVTEPNGAVHIFKGISFIVPEPPKEISFSFTFNYKDWEKTHGDKNKISKNSLQQ